MELSVFFVWNVLKPAQRMPCEEIIMTKIYNKNKLTFSLIWIGIYVVIASVADNLSESIGTAKIITTPLFIIMSIVLIIWVKKNRLTRVFGLTGTVQWNSSVMYYIPLLILITANLWNGVTLNMPIPDTVLYIVSMLFVGFLEELIFRGFLFKALCESGIKKAFIISSVTFGIGHIVNLVNGADILPTILQIISAVVIGFLFTLIYYKTKNLWPCIITHSIFNSLSTFGVESGVIGRIISCVAICVISISYSVYLIKSMKEGQN